MPNSKRSRSQGNQSVLSSLGVSVRPSGGGLRVLSADERVQRINDLRACKRAKTCISVPQDAGVNLFDFHRACRRGSFSEVGLCLSSDISLLQSVSTSSEDSLGSKASCVHFAVLGNNADMVRYLASCGAPVSFLTDRGVSPLHLACVRGYVECAVALIECGANVSERDNFGKTALSILRASCADIDLRKRRAIICKVLERSVKKLSDISSQQDKNLLKISNDILYKQK